ncbi:MAG: hypothetical protein OHK0046_14650 [Anaerolineae bacterium]
MNDLQSVLLSVCGFGAVCCGAFLLAGFLLIRFAGRSVIFSLLPTLGSLLNVFTGGGNNDNDDDDDRPARSVRAQNAPTTHSIHERIEAAKSSTLGSPPPEDPNAQTSSRSLRDRNLPSSFTPSDAGRSLRDRRRYRDSDTGEQVFGGAFDSDFDDIPDFFDDDDGGGRR